MAELNVKALVDAGAHIGCRVGRWNPKMEPYILESRNRIHIIDLKETIRGILRAKHFIREMVASGSDVLFVGTKQQIRGVVSQAREKCKMPYVSDRWIGGTLTNFEVIGSRIAHFEDMEKKEEEGATSVLTKKEHARFNREKAKLHRNLHGIRDMFRLPGALVIIDTKTERKAIREARRMGMPIVGVIDTDCDPTDSDVQIPANDDAIRSVDLILQHLYEAVEEGRALRKERGIPDPAAQQRAQAAPQGAPVPRPSRGRGGPGGPGGRRGPGGPGGKGAGQGGRGRGQGGPARPGQRVRMEGGVNRPVEIQTISDKKEAENAPNTEGKTEGNTEAGE